MNCAEVDALLALQAAGELPPDAETALSNHLSQCALCNACGADWLRQDAALRRAFRERRSAAAATAETVVRRLPRRELNRWRLAATIIGSAAAGFVGAVLLFPPWTRLQTADKAPVQPEKEHESPLPEPKGRAPATPLFAAKLALATGPVEATEAAAVWRPLPVGGDLTQTSRVRTARGARCELRLTDGTLVRMNELTEVGFNAARQLELPRGQVFARVEPAATPFRILWQGVGVTALGTAFDVERSSEGGVVTVCEGSTKIVCGGGEAVVRAGQAVRVAAGRLSQPRRVQDLVTATRWVHEILALKGADDPELAHRIDDLFARIGQDKMDYLKDSEIRMLGDHCVVPLSRYLNSPRSQGPEVETKRGIAAAIVADVAGATSIPDLLSLLDHEDGNVRFQAARGLKRLTGSSFGVELQQWKEGTALHLAAGRRRAQQWWRDNRLCCPSEP